MATRQLHKVTYTAFGMKPRDAFSFEAVFLTEEEAKKAHEALTSYGRLFCDDAGFEVELRVNYMPDIYTFTTPREFINELLIENKSQTLDDLAEEWEDAAVAKAMMLNKE